MPTYEGILGRVATLAASPSESERRVEWLSTASVVGLSRTYDGRLEIFLAGLELAPMTRVVRQSLEYQTWHRAAGEPSLDASRLVLPAAGHFDQVAAFLCTELLRAGADFDLPAAFAKAEPVIELAITRLRLSDEALLGLAGELLLLDAVLRQAPDSQAPRMTQSWLGWRHSTRDFAWDTVGVEVKTTTRATSSHQMRGVHQVEPSAYADYTAPEQHLYLVSIGLEWVQTEQANSHTVSGLVGSIAQRLAATGAGPTSAGAVDTFLAHVREYGAEHEVGYDHLTMSEYAVFTRPFIAKFVRGYDMTDPGVEVLRSRDIRPHKHVDVASVTFRVELPPQVTGDVNPVVGLNAVARAILERQR